MADKHSRSSLPLRLFSIGDILIMYDHALFIKTLTIVIK